MPSGSQNSMQSVNLTFVIIASEFARQCTQPSCSSGTTQTCTHGLRTALSGTSLASKQSFKNSNLADAAAHFIVVNFFLLGEGRQLFAIVQQLLVLELGVGHHAERRDDMLQLGGQQIGRSAAVCRRA